MNAICLYWHALVLHAYATRMYFYVIPMSLVCTHMSSVCHSYVLLCHPYVIRMYSYVIRISLVCTRMSSVWHSYVVLPLNFSTTMVWYKRYEYFRHDVFPLEQQEDFFFKKRCMLIRNIVRHTWVRLPLLAVFVSFRESLDLRLELICMMCDKLTLGRLISWT